VNALRRLLRAVRREGLRASWMKLLHELEIYRRLLLLDIPNEDASSPAGSDVPLDVGLLDAKDIGEYFAFRPDQDAGEIRGRLAEGQWCFVGRHEGRIVTSAWSCAGRVKIDYLECRIKLPERVAFSYDVFTDPAWRGRRVSTVVFDWRRRFLREAGYARSVGVLWPENRPAVRRLAHRTVSVFGTLGTWKLGRFKRHVLRAQPDATDGGVPLVTLEDV